VKKLPFAHLSPHDGDLETAVLGAVLLEAQAQRKVLAQFGDRADIFHRPAHQHIYRAVATLHRAGHGIDLVTVSRQLDKDGKLQAAGGPQGVAALTFHIQGAGHLDDHCRLLLEFYTRRQLISAMQHALQHGYNAQADPLELLAGLQRTVNDLNAALQIKQPQFVGDYLGQVLADIALATERPNGVTGVPSGLRVLDKVTGGWQKSDLIIIAARPAMGKTSLLVSCALHAARAGFPGAIITLEMSAPQLVLKMVAKEAGYTTSQLRRGLLDGGVDEAHVIADKVAHLRQVGVLLDDSTHLTIGGLRAKAAQLKAEHGITWIAVDYLQLMHGDRTSGGNREQEISGISRGLKMLAKELDIPVIALAQLSRAVEQRGGEKRPSLSDLRESGAIEQDADMVIFPYRPEYYKIFEDEMGNSTLDTTELIIGKHRNGGTDEVVVRSVMKFGRYEDLDDYDQADRALAEAKQAQRELPPAPDNKRLVPSGEFSDDDQDLPF
jgi:replicative DNA helicase